MRARLAFRNLMHDRVGLVLVAGGVAVAIVLVHVQLGLFFGFRQMTGALIAHAHADLWIVPKGTKSFDDPQMAPGVQLASVAAIAGVKAVRPLAVGFAGWRAQQGGTSSVIVIGTTRSSDPYLPWSYDEVVPGALDQPDGVVVDRSYQADLGVRNPVEIATIENRRARVVGFTRGIRSFTTSPYVFTRIDRARAYLGLDNGAFNYLLVELVDPTAIVQVKAALSRRLTTSDVLTTQEFFQLNASRWLFSTGAGAALLGGAILGVVVGAAIVAQTIYASTKEHLHQFATLRALGARSRYIVDIVLLQAGLSGLLGYLIALAMGSVVSASTAATAMPVVMSWPLAMLLLALTLFICLGSAVAAVVKVTRIDPMVVFTR